MHHGSACQRDTVRIAVDAVLADRVFHGLVGELVLQLGRRHQQSVDEEPEIDRLGRTGFVCELTSDVEPVGVVVRHQVGAETVCWPEVRKLDGDAVVDHAVTQHVDGAPLVELSGETGDELRLRTRQPTVTLLELIPAAACVAPRKANRSSVSMPVTGSNADGRA